MAYLIPEKQLEEIDFNGSSGEEQLYKEFLELDDNYIIFHSLDWMSKNKYTVRFGEADFIVFHKQYGIISLEIKHGGIAGENGVIYQINRKTKDGKPIDPISQANKSTYKFRDILSGINDD
ncbi:hypothetical protein BU020_12970, partial [Staphylococcus simulans]